MLRRPPAPLEGARTEPILVVTLYLAVVEGSAADRGLDGSQCGVPCLRRVALTLLDVLDGVQKLLPDGRAVRSDEERLQAEQRIGVDHSNGSVVEERVRHRRQLRVLVDRWRRRQRAR